MLSIINIDKEGDCLTERENEILSLIRAHPEISQQEIGDQLNITRSSVAVHISNLMKKGKILGKGYIVAADDSICVLGAVNVDIIATPYAPIIDHDSNPGFMKYSFGGVGRNIAENLARLGQKVEMITVIGDDLYANQLTEDCTQLGISLRHALRLSHENTSTYVCVNDEQGEMLVAVSAMDIYAKLTPDYLKSQLKVINQARVAVMDMNLSEEAIAFLTEHVQVPIFVDPVSTKKAMKIKPYLNRVHTLKPNLLEAELLLDREIQNDSELEAAAQQFLDKGVQNVYITLGERGVYYAGQTGCGWLKNLPSEIVNTTGCGDAFMAGVLYGFLQELPTEQCARIGLRASHLCIESPEAVSRRMNQENLRGENE